MQFLVVLEQIRVLIGTSHLEVSSPRPFRFALNLVPEVQDFFDFQPLSFQQKTSGRGVHFVTGITLNLKGREMNQSA